MLVNRSTSCWLRPLDFWAVSTSFTRRLTEFSSAAAVARKTRLPVRFRVPAKSRSPGFFSIGMDSPVRLDSSTAEAPSSTTPSVGIDSPGRTRIRSPRWRRAASHDGLGSVPEDARLSGDEVEEAFDRAFRPVVREVLDGFGQTVEEDERSGLVPEAEGRGADGRRGHEHLDADLAAVDELLPSRGGPSPAPERSIEAR